MQEQKQLLEEDLNFRLPEDNQFPTVIFEGLTPLQIKDKIGTDFIAMQERGVKAERLMTIEEITEVRAEYGEIAETELPELRDQLETATADFKALKERLTAEITAKDNQFRDLVYKAKRGIADFEPESENTFKIPVAGHYLYYTWTGSKFQLISAKPIPENQRFDLFNTGDKNAESFKALGYDIPDFEAENKDNYRIVDLENGVFVEIWEECGKDVVRKRWKEDFADEETGEVTTIERKEMDGFPLGENPYETKTKERQTDEVPSKSAE